MTTKKPTHKKENTIRVFFALWPDPAIQKQLGQIARRLKPMCEGRAVQTQNIHLTLAFLGNIDINRLPELQLAASRISVQSFNFLIQEIDYWKRNKIIYARAKRFPPELYLLAESLSDTLTAASFKFDQHTFKPHITLLRQAKNVTENNISEPIQWHAKEWCLLQSKLTPKGANYIPLGCWPLTPSN